MAKFVVATIEFYLDGDVTLPLFYSLSLFFYFYFLFCFFCNDNGDDYHQAPLTLLASLYDLGSILSKLIFSPR